jgi:hypothetical protein
VRETWRHGDEAIFFGRRYTLIEPTGTFGWLAVETDNAEAKPRVILTEYLRRAPARTAGPP